MGNRGKDDSKWTGSVVECDSVALWVVQGVGVVEVVVNTKYFIGYVQIQKWKIINNKYMDKSDEMRVPRDVDLKIFVA